MLSRINVAIYLIIIATAPAFLGRYFFGISDQIEQLPLILRAIDPSFLSNDYFLNENASVFGPRFYYTQLIVLFSKIASLPTIFFCLTLMASLLIAFVTYLSAFRLFKHQVAGLVAAGLVVTVNAFQFGASGHLFLPGLYPYYLALPFALAAIYFAFMARPWLAVGSALLGSLMQPLIGLEVGVLALVAGGLTECFIKDRLWSRLSRYVYPLVAFIIAAYFLWLMHLPAGGYSEMFIDILFRYRLSHHYIASTFPWREYRGFSSFIIATVVAMVIIRRHGLLATAHRRFIVLLGLLLMSLFVGGYLFTEVISIPVWFSAQVYRLTFVVKWLGFILFAGAIMNTTDRSRIAPQRRLFWFLGSGPFQPVWMLVALVLNQLLLWLNKFVKQPATNVLKVGLPLLFGVVAIYFTSGLEKLQLIVVIAVVAVATRPKWQDQKARAVGLVWLVFITLAIKSYDTHMPLFAKQLYQLRPKLTISDMRYRVQPAAQYARLHLPKEEVLLIPPNQGIVRLLAGRAVHLDVKMLCYRETCVRQWMHRITELLGPVRGRGLRSLRFLEGEYVSLSDDVMRHISKTYGIAYAILYARTPSKFPVLYNDRWFKVVELQPRE